MLLSLKLISLRIVKMNNKMANNNLYKKKNNFIPKVHFCQLIKQLVIQTMICFWRNRMKFNALFRKGKEKQLFKQL